MALPTVQGIEQRKCSLEFYAVLPMWQHQLNVVQLHAAVVRLQFGGFVNSYCPDHVGL